MAKNEVERRSPYSAGQMEALTALCDTLLPSIHLPHHDDDSLTQFYRASASMTGTPQHLAVLLGEKIEHPKIYLSKLALTLLSTWMGTFILCGTKSLSPHFPYFQRFSRISLDNRHQILLSWSRSYFLLLRFLYSALKIFTLLVFFTQVNENNENASWKAIGYHGPDPKAKKPVGDPKPDKEDQLPPLHKGIISFNQSKETALKQLQKLGFPISLQHPGTNRKSNSSKNPSFTVKCDVVVVGSGSGGGVVAGVLAKAGYKVLVLEKGSYLARNDLSLLEGQAMEQMYLGNGILGTDNLDVILLAGSTVGGGSTINWSASIRTPPQVIGEWSEDHKLEFFSSKAYENALDVVCGKMGVQIEFDSEGFNNMVLRKGCERLGHKVEAIPRNAPPDHYCGWCCLGCRDGKKKGVSETWLVDMVESGNGAVLPQCEALQVITTPQKQGGRKRAAGVRFAFQSGGMREVAVVEAKITVVACGAICTPPLLKKSGLKNPNIGKNLHLHPVVMGWGYFPDTVWPDVGKRSYEGGIITAMSRVDGAIIQTPALHPGMFSALMPWLSGTDIKKRMVKYPRTAHIFALTRDKGHGAVNSPTDISYKLDDLDQESLRRGIERVLRILAAAGAEEIGTHHKEGRVLRVKGSEMEELERFVREESSRPLKDLSSPICSAHQMGSCRMGVDPRVSAVGPTGESWEVEGLFVADSSVFPTALGVNPMVTIQAIAYCVALQVLEALGGKKVV